MPVPSDAPKKNRAKARARQGHSAPTNQDQGIGPGDPHQRTSSNLTSSEASNSLSSLNRQQPCPNRHNGSPKAGVRSPSLPRVVAGQLNGLAPFPPRHQAATLANVSRSFNQQVLYDTTPLPDSIPKVKELGVSSAPLLSASFFIGARCREYNDDFMQCKTDNPGKGEFDCLKEGRRVTRCARSVYVYHLGGFSRPSLHWAVLDAWHMRRFYGARD